MRDLEKYQKDYAEQPYERFQVKFRKRKIREVVDKYPHRRILEIGCGLFPLFSDFTDFDQLTVIEPAELFFSEAKRSLEDHPSRNRVELLATTLEASCENLSSKNFDIILLSSLLHEVVGPEVFLGQVHKLASAETIVHVNVPNALSFHRLLAVECGLIKSVYELSACNLQFQQNTIFSLNSLQTIAEQSGFNVIESGSYSFKPFTHKQMEDMFEHKILSEAIIDGLYAMEKFVAGCGSEIFVNLRRKVI